MNNIKKVCRLALLCLSVSTLVACSSLSEKTIWSTQESTDSRERRSY